MIYEKDYNLGLTLVESTTHEFYIGQIQDDEKFTKLRRLLYITKPVEIVYNQEFIRDDLTQIFRSLPYRPMLSPVIQHLPSLEYIFQQIVKYFNSVDIDKINPKRSSQGTGRQAKDDPNFVRKPCPEILDNLLVETS